MSNSNIPVLKFQFREEFKQLKDALNIKPGYEVEDFNSANDLATYLSTTNSGLIIASLKSRDDLIQLATFMKVQKKVAKDATVKVVVVNFSNDKNFERAIAKIGIQDVVEPGINTKALKFKLDFWMKSLNVQLKNAPSKDNSKVVKSNEPGKPGEKSKAIDPSLPVWTDPLDLENDIWIIKNESDAKKVLSKWLVRMLGPSPYVGQWVEVKGGLWRFDLKETERDMYLSGEGAWFFSGDQKPEFVWKENIWLVSGDTFDLYFRDPNLIVSRFKAKDKSLTVCKNSLFAKTKEQMIIESCDKELVFKREAETLSDMEGKNKTDQINNANLEGKSNTDQLNGGNLQGKTKTGADKSGNLSGDLKGGDKITNEDLDQKTKTSKESSYWNGKNTYEKEEGKSDFGIKKDAHNAGSQLEQELKDQNHQKYYKNHNEAQKYDPASLKEGQVGGKSSTDHMPGHYSNEKSDNAKKPQEKNDTSDLAGKSDTDKLKAHYGTKSEFTEKDKPELQGKTDTDKLKSHYGNKEKSEFSEKDKPELQGKSETDKLKSHYGNKDKSETSEKDKPEFQAKNASDKLKSQSGNKERPEVSEKDKPELQGKSETDKLKSHYGNKEKSEFSEKDRPGYEGKSSTDKVDSHLRNSKEAVVAQEKDKKDKTEREESTPFERRNKEHHAPAGQVKEDEDIYASKEKERKKRDQEAKEEDFYSGLKKNLSSNVARPKNSEERDETTSKTAVEESWEGNNKYALKGKKANSFNAKEDAEEENQKSDKLAAEIEDQDDFNDLIKKKPTERNKSDSSPAAKAEREETEKHGASVLPLNRAREEKNKAKSPEEARLDEITQEARVTSIIFSKGQRIECNLDDFFEDTIVFATSDTKLDKNSNVTLNMSFKFQDKDTKLNLEGNIREIEGIDDGTSFVTVALSKDNVAAFNSFMKLYEARQKHITEFLKKAKGVA